MENSKKERILNPFALPPETNARFSLLLVSVIVISLILGNYLPLYFMPEHLTESVLSPKVDFMDTGIDAQDDLKNSGMKMILNSLEYAPSLIVLFLVFILTTLISYYIYTKHDDKIILKQALMPAGEEDNKYIMINKEIKELSGLYRIRPPDMYISRRFTTGAQAFGFKKRSMLRIDSGLKMLSVKDNRKFRSIILHELAHITNDDVSKTYLAGSLWRAVLYVFVVPTILLILMSFFYKILKRISDGFDTQDLKDILFGSVPTILILLFSLGVFFLTMYLLLKSLVRIREYYADWRAATAGAREDLSGLFEQYLSKEQKVSGFRKLFSWHPTMKERIDNLADPSGLFIVKNDLSFLVGLLIPFSLFSFFVLSQIGISLSGIFSGTSQIISQNLAVTFLTVTAGILILILVCFVPFFITSYLICSSIGLQIQKNVIASIDTGNTKVFGLKEVLTTSLIITIGMAAGSLILPYFSVLNLIVENSLTEILFYKMPIVILAFLIAFGVNFLWVFYLKFFAGRLYGRYVNKKSPKLRYFLFNLISALLLSLMILPVAGIYFRIYSREIDFLNEMVNTLLYLMPAIYIIMFALTGLVMWIMNAGNSVCKDCGSSMPPGNLIGKECGNCGSVFSRWLYL